jgi:hypothetical protein
MKSGAVRSDQTGGRSQTGDQRRIDCIESMRKVALQLLQSLFGLATSNRFDEVVLLAIREH